MIVATIVDIGRKFETKPSRSRKRRAVTNPYSESLSLQALVGLLRELRATSFRRTERKAELREMVLLCARICEKSGKGKEVLGLLVQYQVPTIFQEHKEWLEERTGRDHGAT